MSSTDTNLSSGNIKKKEEFLVGEWVGQLPTQEEILQWRKEADEAREAHRLKNEQRHKNLKEQNK